MDIPILFEDDSFLVINKPPGVVVNKAESVVGETVEDWARDRLVNRGLGSKDRDGDFLARAGIVHRLDKETSGILVIAKGASCFQNLQEQFAQRKVHKSYNALVHGVLPSTSGEIFAPIGRLLGNRERFGVVAVGREARTKYRVSRLYYGDIHKEKYSLLDIELLTGRTHQIRVHLKYLGHTVVCDEFYAGRKQYKKDLQICPRLFLHAKEITLSHPNRPENVTVVAPLPKDLQSCLDGLQEITRYDF